MSTDDRTWGLSAYGRSGEVEVSINEIISGERRQFSMEISVPGTQICFRIRDLNTASELFSFLRDHQNRKIFAEIEAGEMGVPVFLVKDDEFVDRFFLRAQDHLTLEFADHVAGDLVDAMGQCADDARV